METDIVRSLANFLEAAPYQVMHWDKKVVDHFTSNPEAMHAFRTGSATTKWDLYAAVKYRAQAAY